MDLELWKKESRYFSFSPAETKVLPANRPANHSPFSGGTPVLRAQRLTSCHEFFSWRCGVLTRKVCLLAHRVSGKEI